MFLSLGDALGASLDVAPGLAAGTSPSGTACTYSAVHRVGSGVCGSPEFANPSAAAANAAAGFGSAIGGGYGFGAAGNEFHQSGTNKDRQGSLSPDVAAGLANAAVAASGASPEIDRLKAVDFCRNFIALERGAFAALRSEVIDPIWSSHQALRRRAGTIFVRDLLNSISPGEFEAAIDRDEVAFAECVAQLVEQCCDWHSISVGLIEIFVRLAELADQRLSGIKVSSPAWLLDPLTESANYRHRPIGVGEEDLAKSFDDTVIDAGEFFGVGGAGSNANADKFVECDESGLGGGRSQAESGVAGAACAQEATQRFLAGRKQDAKFVPLSVLILSAVFIYVFGPTYAGNVRQAVYHLLATYTKLYSADIRDYIGPRFVSEVVYQMLDELNPKALIKCFHIITDVYEQMPECFVEEDSLPAAPKLPPMNKSTVTAISKPRVENEPWCNLEEEVNVISTPPRNDGGEDPVAAAANEISGRQWHHGKLLTGWLLAYFPLSCDTLKNSLGQLDGDEKHQLAMAFCGVWCSWHERLLPSLFESSLDYLAAVADTMGGSSPPAFGEKNVTRSLLNEVSGSLLVNNSPSVSFLGSGHKNLVSPSAGAVVGSDVSGTDRVKAKFNLSNPTEAHAIEIAKILLYVCNHSTPETVRHLGVPATELAKLCLWSPQSDRFWQDIFSCVVFSACQAMTETILRVILALPKNSHGNHRLAAPGAEQEGGSATASCLSSTVGAADGVPGDAMSLAAAASGEDIEREFCASLERLAQDENPEGVAIALDNSGRGQGNMLWPVGVIWQVLEHLRHLLFSTSSQVTGPHPHSPSFIASCNLSDAIGSSSIVASTVAWLVFGKQLFELLYSEAPFVGQGVSEVIVQSRTRWLVQLLDRFTKFCTVWGDSACSAERKSRRGFLRRIINVCLSGIEQDEYEPAMEALDAYVVAARKEREQAGAPGTATSKALLLSTDPQSLESLAADLKNIRQMIEILRMAVGELPVTETLPQLTARMGLEHALRAFALIPQLGTPDQGRALVAHLVDRRMTNHQRRLLAMHNQLQQPSYYFIMRCLLNCEPHPIGDHLEYACIFITSVITEQLKYGSPTARHGAHSSPVIANGMASRCQVPTSGTPSAPADPLEDFWFTSLTQWQTHVHRGTLITRPVSIEVSKALDLLQVAFTLVCRLAADNEDIHAAAGNNTWPSVLRACLCTLHQHSPWLSNQVVDCLVGAVVASSRGRQLLSGSNVDFFSLLPDHLIAPIVGACLQDTLESDHKEPGINQSGSALVSGGSGLETWSSLLSSLLFNSPRLPLAAFFSLVSARWNNRTSDVAGDVLEGVGELSAVPSSSTLAGMQCTSGSPCHSGVALRRAGSSDTLEAFLRTAFQRNQQATEQVGIRMVALLVLLYRENKCAAVNLIADPTVASSTVLTTLLCLTVAACYRFDFTGSYRVSLLLDENDAVFMYERLRFDCFELFCEAVRVRSGRFPPAVREAAGNGCRPLPPTAHPAEAAIATLALSVDVAEPVIEDVDTTRHASPEVSIPPPPVSSISATQPTVALLAPAPSSTARSSRFRIYPLAPPDHELFHIWEACCSVLRNFCRTNSETSGISNLSEDISQQPQHRSPCGSHRPQGHETVGGGSGPGNLPGDYSVPWEVDVVFRAPKNFPARPGSKGSTTEGEAGASGDMPVTSSNHVPVAGSRSDSCGPLGGQSFYDLNRGLRLVKLALWRERLRAPVRPLPPGWFEKRPLVASIQAFVDWTVELTGQQFRYHRRSCGELTSDDNEGTTESSGLPPCGRITDFERLLMIRILCTALENLAVYKEAAAPQSPKSREEWIAKWLLPFVLKISDSTVPDLECDGEAARSRLIRQWAALYRVAVNTFVSELRSELHTAKQRRQAAEASAAAVR